MLKAVCQNTLPFHSHRKITARFDGGSLTSDAGWLLFGSLDRQHRLCEGFSSCIAESRDRRYVRHDLLKLIRQRVLQIVAGYEDCNDADTLRSDPMLKTVCDQLPESDPDLATQPTFSRLENSVTKKDLMRLSRWLLGRYVRSLKKRRPAKIRSQPEPGVHHSARRERCGDGLSDKQWGRMSRLRFGPTAALPRLGSTSSVNVKRINSSMSLG